MIFSLPTEMESAIKHLESALGTSIINCAIGADPSIFPYIRCPNPYVRPQSGFPKAVSRFSAMANTNNHTITP